MRQQFKPTGIICLHPITDDQMPGSASKNLEKLGGLCTDAKAEHLRLVTTMWDRVKDANLAESKVSQLETNFWKPPIDAGARHE
ncbi:hypothetical protein EDC04DRAFT_2582056 [Pisolithus marmoratus]|nr:hypothetical protein EDC04DRAFT_2582056 [Pisolithus marmoratus]